MSSYGDQPGQQPDNPWAQQPGTPPPPPPGQGVANPYGGAPAGYGYGQPAALPYSFWGKRVGATLLDGLLTLLAAFPVIIGIVILVSTADPRITVTNPDGTVTTSGSGDAGNPISFVFLGLGFLTYFAFYVWNTFIRQGRTGYTIGKGLLGIKLVREADGQPIGAGLAFVRQICHILDGFCYIGYLWPLWDAKRQTFADKIINTVVLDIPKK